MEKLSVRGTDKIPTINLDPSTGILEITGISFPEDGYSVFKPVVQWIEEYGKAPLPKTELHVNLEYMNTSTSKMMMFILQTLEKLSKSGNSEVKVVWFYEEEDSTYDFGSEVKEFLKLNFVLEQLPMT